MAAVLMALADVHPVDDGDCLYTFDGESLRTTVPALIAGAFAVCAAAAAVVTAIELFNNFSLMLRWLG
jgi:hypothetical protein